MKDGRDGAGFWKNGRFYWDGQEDDAFFDELKSKDRREKVNGRDPEVSPYCECGAKFDKSFPNIHSRWCPAYRGNT